MYRGHDFSGRGADHREAEDAIVAVADQGFHEAFPLIGGLRRKHGVHRQLCDANVEALTRRLAFAQPDARERRVGEQAIWNKAIARAAIPAGEIVTYDPEIVFGYMRELRASGAFPDRPYVCRTRLQPLVDTNEPARIQFDAGLFKYNSGGICYAPGREQDVAAVNLSFTPGGAQRKRNLVSRSPVDLAQLGPNQNLNTFLAENTQYLIRDVRILASQQTGTGIDDGHFAAKASKHL